MWAHTHLPQGLGVGGRGDRGGLPGVCAGNVKLSSEQAETPQKLFVPLYLPRAAQKGPSKTSRLAEFV